MKAVLVGGAKIHFVCNALAEALQKELVDRFEYLILSEDRTTAFIDRPGMVMVDRTMETFRLDEEFVLEIPTTDVEYFYNELNGAPLRAVGKQEYYKIHGYMSCIVFTPQQRKTLLEQVKINFDGLRLKALSQDAEFDRRIASINKDRTVVITTPRVVNNGDTN